MNDDLLKPAKHMEDRLKFENDLKSIFEDEGIDMISVSELRKSDGYYFHVAFVGQGCWLLHHYVKSIDDCQTYSNLNKENIIKEILNLKGK